MIVNASSIAQFVNSIKKVIMINIHASAKSIVCANKTIFEILAHTFIRIVAIYFF